MVEKLANLQTFLGESLGETRKLRELVLVSSLERDLDEMVQCKGLFCRYIGSER